MTRGREQDERLPRPEGLTPENDVTAANAAPDRVTEVARLELLEERANVVKRSEVANRVQVRREVERRQETVTVELVTETLVIEVVEGTSGVLIGEEQLMPGETREIVTYREEAVVTKQPVVSEEVRLLKRAVTNQEQFNVELGREVLRVEETPLDGHDQPLVRHDELEG